MGFQLFVCKAIIDCDSERMIGPEVIAQKIQRLFVKLDSFISLFLLTVVLE